MFGTAKIRKTFGATALMIFVIGTSGAVHAADDANANRTAYNATVSCFVVNTVLADDAQKQGKTELYSSYDAKAHKAFDYAVKLGAVLHFDNARVNHDFETAQAQELPKMLADTTYFKSKAGTCKALGLI